MADEKMSLTAHLEDLRKRIIVSLAVVLVAFVATFNYSEDILGLLLFPLRNSLDFSVTQMYVRFVPVDRLHATKLVFLAPTEAFWMNMKVALVAALIVALPVIFHQLWRFISPGLNKKEKKYVLPFVFSATGLFLIGASFCFVIVLPFALGFLLNYKVGDFLMPMLSVGQYVDFCLKFVLAFGAIFELPIILIFLTKIGIVTPETLKRNRRMAIVLAFVAGALLTPTPDAFNQTLMAVPIILLYEVGIQLSVFFAREKPDGDG
ncbi:MAG TPA: twin-arginine translocase subunit TatC [Dissulfurispiraceae bacterium]|nr:twin-arginine translocase subunit TatC [Dissulfurispiraceae bacterium]